MPAWDDWNRVDEEEDEELQDALFETKRDVILFAIDCSPSMLAPYADPENDGTQTCHLLTALDAAVQIQKKKAIVGPNDSVGIMLFNTTRRDEGTGQGSEIKKGTFLFQELSQITVDKVEHLIQLIDAARQDISTLQDEFPPLQKERVPTGDVFTSCNWVLRDGAPKTATKRVFLITDEDDPHPGMHAERFKTSAQTTLVDLVQAGAQVEPFFVATDAKPFEVTKFYSGVLLPGTMNAEDGEDGESALPEQLSITRVNDLLAQMRFHEAPKRALFSVPFTLADGFVIGVKGYGLVTEQKKGAYKYFADLGDRMEVAGSRTVYVDEAREAEVDKSQMLFGMELGATAASTERREDQEDMAGGGAGPARAVHKGQRVFYTPDEVRSFRTLGLEPGIKLLGFKDRSELAFEDNVKHSQFIYPDEATYAGSKRTFAALLRSMLKKKKIGICLALTRRATTPSFCAMLPQAEATDEGGWNDPPGIHLIPLPFADDIRAAPIEQAERATEELKDAARAIIDKLSIKNGAYPPDSYPNPALGFHNAQLQAAAFREEFDPEAFEDLTLPKIDMIHKRAGKLISAWKEALLADDRADQVVAKAAAAGTKRKATDSGIDDTEVKARYDEGLLAKMSVAQLKEFLKAKSQPVSGKKAELVDRVSEWFMKH